MSYLCADHYLVRERGKSAEISPLATFYCESAAGDGDDRGDRRPKEVPREEEVHSSGDCLGNGGVGGLCVPRCCGRGEVADMSTGRVKCVADPSAELVRPAVYSEWYPHEIPDDSAVDFAYGRLDAMESEQCPGDYIALHLQVRSSILRT